MSFPIPLFCSNYSPSSHFFPISLNYLFLLSKLSFCSNFLNPLFLFSPLFQFPLLPNVFLSCYSLSLSNPPTNVILNPLCLPNFLFYLMSSFPVTLSFSLILLPTLFYILFVYLISFLSSLFHPTFHLPFSFNTCLLITLLLLSPSFILYPPPLIPSSLLSLPPP